MSKHISRERNPKIAHVFFLAGFIEAWDRGYEKIMREYDKANLKHPIFMEEHGGVTAVIPREIFMSIRNGHGVTSAHGAESGTKSGAESGAKNDADLTARQIEIQTMIKENPTISLDKIADKFGIGTTTVDREIKKLNGFIKRE